MLDWATFEARFGLKRQLSSSHQTTVYQGEFQGHLAAIKLAHKTPQTRLAFRREGALLALLKHSLAPSCFEVGQVEQQVYLAMSLIEGRSLRACLEAEGRWEIPRVLRLLRDLLQQLVALHRSNYVHRDIKPSNVIIDLSGQAHLIDYHSAIQAEHQVDRSSMDVGTLAYCAPEQSRMLARPLDPRADLYALGGVIYECLVGERPLQADTAEELAHLHASQLAPRLDLHCPDAPTWLTAMIARCLAKDPNDRFAHATHMLALLDRLEATHSGEESVVDKGRSVEQWLHFFGLYESAHSRAATSSLPLVGRQSELQRGVTLWEQCRTQRKGAAVLVEAAPGAGKSRLSQELLTRAAPSLGIAVKCVRESTVPLAPWRAALRQAWHMLRSMPDAERHAMEESLRHALQPYVSLLAELAPEWRQLWAGEEGEPSSTIETRELYYTMLSDLWLLIVQATQGTVLIIDDVQWMDTGSLEIIKRLVHQWAETPLLLVATARNDPESVGGLTTFKGVYHDWLRLSLASLQREQVDALVQDFLGASVEDALLSYVWEQSQGSPFAIHQYLKLLVDSGLLWPSGERWHFDHETASSLALPQDIVGLLLHRIQQLSSKAIDVLQLFAVLGFRADLKLLQGLLPIGPYALSEALSEAMFFQLMSCEGELYRFSHDRVHEAFLAALSPEKRREHHLTIARKLESMLDSKPSSPGSGASEPDGDDGGEGLFSCARHYLAALGDEPKEDGGAAEADKPGDEAQALDRSIAGVGLRAGQAALSAYAEGEALRFLEGARQAYQRLGETQPAMLDYSLGLAHFRLGRYEQAHTCLERVLAESSSPLMRARAHQMRADLFVIDYKPKQAEESVEKAFQELRVAPPQPNVWGVLQAVMLWVAGMVMCKMGWGVGSARGEEAEKKRLLVQLYETRSRSCFFQLRDVEFLQNMFPLFFIAHQLGEPADLVRAYNAYSLFMGTLTLPGKVLHYRDLALSHAKGNPPLVARTTIYAYWGLNLAGTDPGLTQKFHDALSTHGHLMDPFEWANCNAVLEMALSIHGYMEEAEAVALQSIQQLKINNEKITEHGALHGPLHTLSIARSSMGKMAQAQTNYQEAQGLLRLESYSPYTQCWALGASALMYLEIHDFGDQFEQICEAHTQYQLKPSQAPVFLRFFYVYQAMARTLQYLDAPEAERAQLWPRLKAAQHDLKKTTNKPFFRSFLTFVDGGVALVQGQGEEAQALLEEACAQAMAWDNPMLLCESLFMLARLFAQKGLLRQSQQASEQAFALARRHRWQHRIRRIARHFPLVLDAKGVERTESAPSLFSTTQTTTLSSLRFKRHMNALLEINLASAVTREPAARARAILAQLVDLLGAERACLFVTEPEQGQGEHSLRLVASHYASADTRPFDYDKAAIEHVKETQTPYLYPPLDGHDAEAKRRIRSIIAAPLLIHDGLRGVVYLDSQLVGGLFHREDVEILQALANHIAVALDAAEAADRLAQARDEALAANRAKSLFLATMSHELRTPLNAIIGYSELIQDDFEDELPDEVHGDLQSIHRSAYKLLGIIEDVLSLTDLDTNRFVLDPSDFLLAPFVEEVVAEIEPLFQAHQNHFVLTDIPEGARLCSDRRKCRHVLFHILHNAARFTRNGEVGLTIDERDDGWQMTIADTGVGMTEEVQEQIFEPFYQADMSPSREYDGAGMGLAIARRLCDALGGAIEVESEPGVGSTFRVWLPRQLPDAAQVVVEP